MRARCLVAAAALLLAACGQQPADPVAVTDDEDRQLNDAAAALSANAPDADATQDNGQ